MTRFISARGLQPARPRWATVPEGGVVTFGSSRDNQSVVLCDTSGSPLRHVSSKAGFIKVHEGQTYVVNRSFHHELVIRPWGGGWSNDRRVPPRYTQERRPTVRMDPGLWWVRNGRSMTQHGLSREPFDGECDWILLDVSQVPSGPKTERGSTLPLGQGPDAGHVSLTRAETRALLLVFSEYLGAPPRVFPGVVDGRAARDAWGSDLTQRRSDIRTKALDAGYLGSFNADLLFWMISEGHLRPAMVYGSTDEMVRRALHLGST